jgi:hypothetical protein
LHTPAADVEVAGVVDGGLGAQRAAFLVVLFDLGVLVVHVQTWGDSGGEYPGAEPTRGRILSAAADLPVEDQPDRVRPADVEVLPDHLLEEHPPRARLVEHVGQGELGLQDRHVIAVARGPILRGERVRQDRQPLA